MHNITVCLTSCGRFDLLSNTLDSLFRVNTYPIHRVIISEDSTDTYMQGCILDKYGGSVELLFNEYNLGICKSTDNMYRLVDTEYIFHCEDDWEFFDNTNFMQESVDILEERKDIHRVCLRTWLSEYLESETQFTANNVEFELVKSPYKDNWCEWGESCGFSNNPGLRRKSDYLHMFPNGYSEFVIRGKSQAYSEWLCGINAMKYNYRSAVLKNKACKHIGWGRSTIE